MHAKVLLDRLDGTIAEILDKKRTLGPDEAWSAADGYLDAYVNQTFRSLKNHRDGRAALSHLDAAESVPFALEVLFALHQRVRPYNKYLQWELVRNPLGDPQWDVDQLLPTLRRIIADGDPDTQRSLFAGNRRSSSPGRSRPTPGLLGLRSEPAASAELRDSRPDQSASDGEQAGRPGCH
ncbi:hypothetical protein [Streptomyces sp. 8K308]|uniref:hypothetical protein n=1 Tax=Streptomyces sp. 8K308 TaxID=2530388 RepID=UPI0026818FE1